eukprot:835888-Prymnesium_polylepis.1
MRRGGRGHEPDVFVAAAPRHHAHHRCAPSKTDTHHAATLETWSFPELFALGPIWRLKAAVRPSVFGQCVTVM